MFAFVYHDKTPKEDLCEGNSKINQVSQKSPGTPKEFKRLLELSKYYRNIFQA